MAAAAAAVVAGRYNRYITIAVMTAAIPIISLRDPPKSFRSLANFIFVQFLLRLPKANWAAAAAAAANSWLACC